MAVMTTTNLREKTSQELVDLIFMEKKRLFDATVKGASGESIKPHEKRQGRRLIARIQSVLSERRRRHQLDAQIKKLEPLAAQASATFARRVKDIDARAAAIKAELAKTEGRNVKPIPPRVRLRNIACGQASPADRAAL